VWRPGDGTSETEGRTDILDGAAKSRKFRKSSAFSGEKQGFPAAISAFCHSVILVCLSFVFSAGHWGKRVRRPSGTAEKTKEKDRQE
jgi:hypothetical protein